MSNRVKAIRESDDGGYHVTTVTTDSAHGSHHHLVVITDKERATIELEANSKAAMQALIKAKSKVKHVEWIAEVRKLKPTPVLTDLIDDPDLGI